jgi:putative SOS response-associated peptidase YedK
MCAQFFIEKELDALARLYGVKPPKDKFDWKPRVFPKYRAPVLVQTKDKAELVPAGFGLIPFWEKGEKPKKVYHNARSETAHELNTFKRAFATSRCIIPIDSFFEWVVGDSGKKEIVRFYPKDGETLSAAGLFSVWKNEDGIAFPNFTILTKSPPKFVKEVGHDRCPFFLKSDAALEWINPEVTEIDDLQEILKKGSARIDWDVERLG